MSKPTNEVTFNLQNPLGMRDRFSKMFEETLDQNNFTSDVIVKVGPEKYEYYCHRLILAASSDFLLSLLSSAESGTIPVILLPDVSFSVIDYVLYYIYYGEVQVPVELYAEFYQACKLLMLKGLVNENEFESDTEDGSDDDEEGSENVQTPKDLSSDEDESDENDESETTKDNFVSSNQKLNSTQNQKKHTSMTPETEKTAHENLVWTLKRCYKKLGIPLTRTVLPNINRSTLVIVDKTLIKGLHNCIFCGKSFSITYVYFPKNSYIRFRYSSFKVHLTKKHADKIRKH